MGISVYMPVDNGRNDMRGRAMALNVTIICALFYGLKNTLQILEIIFLYIFLNVYIIFISVLE